MAGGVATGTGNRVRLGIAIMLLGMLMFSLNDAMGKWLVATYSVGQVLLIRSLFALLILIPFIWRLGLPRLFGVDRPRIQGLRVAFATAEVFCFYWAVQYLPLANVMTYWLAAPILTAALAPILLREKVGLWQWAAIAVGFVGVLIALSPSVSLYLWPTVVAMIGMTCFTFMMITGRSLRGTPDVALVFWQNAGAGVAVLVLSFFSWTQPTGPDFILLGLLGIVAMTAHVCVTRALKLADAAIIAPFQYSLLPFAIIWGWLFFRDVPPPSMLLGGVIIFAAGFFLFVIDQRSKKAS